MYTLKQKPEEFIVREISSVKIQPSGRFMYIKVTKKNRNTLDVVRQISRNLGIKEKDVGFAGTKDKHAITEQMMSLLGVGREKVEMLVIDNVTIEIIGFGNVPISLGDLDGNTFEILVRYIDPLNTLQKNTIPPIDYVENYFDEQRFSSQNVAVGKALITKNFKEVCALLELEVIQNNYIGALQRLPIRLLRLYVNAFQSYVWNQTVAEYLSQFNVAKKIKYSMGEFVFVSERKDIQITQIPLIGFDSFDTNEDIKHIIETIMEQEGITHKDFIIKQLPELSLEGEMRDLFIDVKNMIVEHVDEGIKVSFTLGKGSYATMVIRKMFG